MTTLVTGGSGFIGTELVRNLLTRGDEVRVLDHKPATTGATSVRGDIRDRELVEQAVEGVTLIYHLAAEHRDDVQPVSLYDEVNVDATRHLVQAAARAGVGTIVFTSSVAVYGLDVGVPSEDTPPQPFNDYGRTKLAAEQIVLGWAAAAPGRRAIIVRPSVVFGENNRGNVYNLLEQITRGRFVMVGRGANRKSMAYVKTLVDFLIYVAALPDPQPIYNYADKPDLSMNELIRFARRLLGRPPPRLRLPYAVGLVAGYAFDVVAKVSGWRLPVSAIRVRKFCASTQVATAHKESSGFQPSYSLQEGLERMIRHEFGAGRADSHRTSSDAADPGCEDRMLLSAEAGRPGAGNAGR